MSLNTKNIEQANQFLSEQENGSFTVMDENGYPSTSAVWLINQGDISEVYFSTEVGSNKYKRLQKSSKASLNCHDNARNLTLVGDAEILTDQAIKTKQWREPFIHIYPEGDTDPTYSIIRLKTKRVSMFLAEAPAEFELD